MKMSADFTAEQMCELTYGAAQLTVVVGFIKMLHCVQSMSVKEEKHAGGVFVRDQTQTHGRTHVHTVNQ